MSDNQEDHQRLREMYEYIRNVANLSNMQNIPANALNRKPSNGINSINGTNRLNPIPFRNTNMMDNSDSSVPLSNNPFNIRAPVPHSSRQTNMNNISSSNSTIYTPDLSVNKTPKDDPSNPANANNNDEEETIVTTSNKKAHVDPNTNANVKYSSEIYNKIRIKENAVDEKIRCDICLDGQAYYKDEIVICEMCHCAVHQLCYGRELEQEVPKGEWLCPRCKWINDHSNGDTTISQMINKIKCDLCYKYKGCIVDVKSNFCKWVHHACVYFIPGLQSNEVENTTEVTGKVNIKKKYLGCSLCRQKKGCCIQCQYKDCATSFHVSCAMKANLIKDWRRYENIAEVEAKPIFCKKHEEVGSREITKRGSNALQADFQKTNQKRENQKIRRQNIKNGTNTQKKKIQYVMLKFKDDEEDTSTDEDDENYEINAKELKEVNDEDRRLRSKPKNSNRKRQIKDNHKAQENLLEQDPSNPAIYQTISSMINNNAENQWLLQRLSNQINNLLGKKQSRSKSKSAVNVQPQMAQMNNVQRHNDAARKQTRSNGVQQSEASNKNQNGKKKQSKVTNTQQTRLIDPNIQYSVRPDLAKLIGISKGKINEICYKFISYAVGKKLVDPETCEYNVFKDAELKTIMNIDKFNNRNLRKKLFRFISTEVLYEENKASGHTNFGNTLQNGHLNNLDKPMDERQSSKTKLKRKMKTQNKHSDKQLDVDIIDLTLANNLRGVDQQASRRQGPSSSRIQQVGVRNQRKQVVSKVAQNFDDEDSCLTKDDLKALRKIT